MTRSSSGFSVGGVSVRTVLVVEDEPMLRMLAVEMLEDAGHVVVEFGNAVEAIAYCDDPDHAIAAILTDINMPGDLDGLDLARHVRATRPGTAIVVTSGRYAAMPCDIKPEVTFLPKPWTSDRLVSAITAA